MANLNISVDKDTEGNVNLIYILYLVGIVFGPVAIVGVIMAYLGRSKSGAVIDSHYSNQINLFWKYLLFMLIGALLSYVLIGYLMLLAAVVWFVIRNVQGLQAMSRGEAIARPDSWGFSHTG